MYTHILVEGKKGRLKNGWIDQLLGGKPKGMRAVVMLGVQARIERRRPLKCRTIFNRAAAKEIW